MMKIECGDCDDFVELTVRNFGEILDGYGFRPVKCASDRGGRECVLMVESKDQRLLFVRSDGAETCELGSLDAEFTTNAIDPYGGTGWYNVVSLLEFKTRKKLLTRRRRNKFLDRRADYFAWQAELLSENAGMLFELFEAGREKTWRDEFARFLKEKVGGGGFRKFWRHLLMKITARRR